MATSGIALAYFGGKIDFDADKDGLRALIRLPLNGAKSD
jgi:hypothetical protein